MYQCGPWCVCSKHDECASAADQSLSPGLLPYVFSTESGLTTDAGLCSFSFTATIVSSLCSVPVPLPFANGTCFLKPRKYNHIIPLLVNLGCSSQMQHHLSLAFKALCKQPQSAASLPIIISYIFHAPDTVNEFLFLRIAILFYHGILICFS